MDCRSASPPIRGILRTTKTIPPAGPTTANTRLSRENPRGEPSPTTNIDELAGYAESTTPHMNWREPACYHQKPCREFLRVLSTFGVAACNDRVPVTQSHQLRLPRWSRTAIPTRRGRCRTRGSQSLGPEPQVKYPGNVPFVYPTQISRILPRTTFRTGKKSPHRHRPFQPAVLPTSTTLCTPFSRETTYPSRSSPDFPCSLVSILRIVLLQRHQRRLPARRVSPCSPLHETAWPPDYLLSFRCITQTLVCSHRVLLRDIILALPHPATPFSYLSPSSHPSNLRHLSSSLLFVFGNSHPMYPQPGTVDPQGCASTSTTGT